MRIASPAFADGKIADRYGAKGGVFVGAMASVSFPFEIEDAPDGTVSFAAVFDDPDVVRLKGFPWHHWLLSGLRKTSLPEDASRTDGSLVQGVTTWFHQGRAERSESCFYGGPNPPDGPHRYVFTVYALDYLPGLRSGFEYEDLMKAVEGHTLAKAAIEGVYSPLGEVDADVPGNPRIAVPYDEGEVFQHFGRTPAFKVYEVYDKEVVASDLVDCEGAHHSAVVGVLASTGARTLICGGIGEGAYRRLCSMGIKVVSGITGTADAAVRDYLAGRIGSDPKAGVHESPGMLDS